MKDKPLPVVISQRHEELSPLALALSAGGARGAYQIGCWKAFLERGISFQAVSGSSIGALNAAFICQGDLESALSFWNELSKTRVLTPDYVRLRRLILRLGTDVALFIVPVPNLRTVRLLKYAAASVKVLSRHGSLGALVREGLVRMENLEPLLGRYLDFKQVLRQPIPLFATVTEVTSVGRGGLGPQWFRLQDLDEAGARKILAASLSLPIVSARIVYNERSYVDGGIAQWAPIEPLYEAGFRKIVLVSTKARVRYDPRNYPGCSVSVVKPEKSLGRFPVGTFRFTRHAIGRWINQGYEDASVLLDKKRHGFTSYECVSWNDFQGGSDRR